MRGAEGGSRAAAQSVGSVHSAVLWALARVDNVHCAAAWALSAGGERVGVASQKRQRQVLDFAVQGATGLRARYAFSGREGQVGSDRAQRAGTNAAVSAYAPPSTDVVRTLLPGRTIPQLPTLAGTNNPLALYLAPDLPGTKQHRSSLSSSALASYRAAAASYRAGSNARDGGLTLEEDAGVQTEDEKARQVHQNQAALAPCKRVLLHAVLGQGLRYHSVGGDVQ
eukprot:1321911-Rhodomonas_salina.5